MKVVDNLFAASKEATATLVANLALGHKFSLEAHWNHVKASLVALSKD